MNLSIKKKQKQDLYLVGGGVIGLSIAVLLLQRGYHVTVIEKNTIGRGAGWASAGMLSPLSEVLLEETFNRSLYQFSFDNVSFWPEWAEMLKTQSQIDIDLRDEGTLQPVLENTSTNSRSVGEYLEARQLPFKLLSREETRRSEPFLSGRVRQVYYLKRDIQVNPKSLMSALLVAFSRLGGKSLHAEVVGIKKKSGQLEGVELKKPDGSLCTVKTERLVLSPGASGLGFLEKEAINSSVYPVKGQMFSLYSERNILNHVIRTSEIYMAPKSNGEIVCGATSEPYRSDNNINEAMLASLYQKAVSLFPVLGSLRIKEKWAGNRPATRDGLPLIGPLATEGVFMACGHYRAGVTQSPLTAKAVLDWLENHFDTEYYRPFRPDRLFTTVRS